jgi:hypothetical protein
MSRFDEIPQLDLEYGREWSDLASDAINAYFEATRFAIREVARSENWKATAILGWFLAASVWLPLLWCVIAGVKP